LAFYFCGQFALRSAGVDAVANESKKTPLPASKMPPILSSFWTTAAGLVAGCAALGFCFWLLAVPVLARQPIFFFVFVFLADAGILALPVVGRAHRAIAFVAGALTFALVAAWIGLFAQHAPLLTALAAIVIFAFLHAATVPASAWRPGMLPLTAA